MGRIIEANHFKAKSAIGVQKVVERLGNHVREKLQGTEGVDEPRAQAIIRREVAELKARLEATVSRQLDRFFEVLVKSPDQARPALEQALEEIKGHFTTALESLEKPLTEIDEILERRDLRGAVESVDLEAELMTIRTQTGAVLAVAIGPNTRAEIGEESGSPGDLQEGDQVQVRFDGTGAVTRIHAIIDAHAKGRIEGIDIAGRTITVALPEGAYLTLTVPDSAEVQINDHPASLEDLELGSVVRVTYNRRSGEILNVAAELLVDLNLTVEDVDQVAGTVTGRTDDGRIVTFRAPARTRIEVGGNHAGTAALKPGARIQAIVDTTSGEALRIEAEEQDLEREVKARGVPVGVSIEEGTLTLKLHDGSHLTILVDSASAFRLDGDITTFGDIRTDTVLEIFYDPTSRIALEVDARTRIHPSEVVRIRPLEGEARPEETGPIGDRTVAGVIGGLDLFAGTVTIYTDDRRVLPLKVSGRTVITLNGESVETFIDLPLAAKVKAIFTTGNEAVEIHAAKREVDIENIRLRAEAPGIQARIRQARTALSVEVKGIPVPGERIAFLVTSNQHPIESADITLNGRFVGTTNARGVLEFAVPTGIDHLEVTTSFEDHSTSLKLRVITKIEEEDRHELAIRLKQEAEQEVVRHRTELVRRGERFKAELSELDEATRQCILIVIGHLPSSEDEVTESDKRRVAAK